MDNISSHESKRTILTVILILLISSAGYISIDLYLPSLPAIASSYAITSSLAQLTVTVFLISFCLSQLIYGPLSDYYGRKGVLVVGIVIYLIGTIFCFVADSISFLLLARFLQGLGIGAGAVLSRVMLRDSFSGNKFAQMASILNTGVSVVTTVAPIIGGFIQQYFNYRGNFFFMLIFGFALFVILFFTPETNQNKLPTQSMIQDTVKIYFETFKQKVFLCNVICAGVALSILIAYSFSNPFLLQTLLGVSPVHYGLLVFLVAGCEIVGSLISSYFVVRIGIAHMLRIGLFLTLISGVLMGVLGMFVHPSIISILFPAFLAAIGIGIVFPNASAGAFSAFKSRIGVVGALYGFLQILLTALSTAAIAGFHVQTQGRLGIVIIVVSLIGFAAFFLLYGRTIPQLYDN